MTLSHCHIRIYETLFSYISLYESRTEIRCPHDSCIRCLCVNVKPGTFNHHFVRRRRQDTGADGAVSYKAGEDNVWALTVPIEAATNLDDVASYQVRASPCAALCRPVPPRAASE